jgi:hypothetical protein
VKPSLPSFQVSSGEADDADARLARELAARIQSGQVRPEDAPVAERLAQAHPSEPNLATLHAVTLLVLGNREAEGRRYAEAAARYEQALAVKPDLEAALLGLMSVRLDQALWSQAEQAARRVLALTARQPQGLRGLGYALLRQDRDAEAREILETALQVQEDAQVRSWLAHLRKADADEAGMRAQNLAHFHVRYDGEEHEDVGREVLRLLDRHHARLVTTLDHQPAAPIPVVLFSREAYYSASGAPAWSGGVYNHFDGRIRVPIGGLGAGLAPDLEGVLLHEVTHAFLGEMSGGVVPRDVNEGFAQYMEGKRASDAELSALASGRLPLDSVQGFYLGALSFVEYLMGLRGQGGMNELLRTMGETRSAEEAFRRVHGSEYRALKQAWWARLRSQYAK